MKDMFINSEVSEFVLTDKNTLLAFSLHKNMIDAIFKKNTSSLKINN